MYQHINYRCLNLIKVWTCTKTLSMQYILLNIITFERSENKKAVHVHSIKSLLYKNNTEIWDKHQDFSNSAQNIWIQIYRHMSTDVYSRPASMLLGQVMSL